jgi:Sec region non-globular protein
MKNNTQVTNSGSPELDASLWMDDSLAMQPDYLPGFDGSQSNPNESETSKDADSEKNANSSDEKPNMRPLPQITGNYSIWGSFVDFLSKYQKAFYIFGILILFGLYRLRAGGGGSSSSRKSAPTIRRLRR